MSDAYEVRLVDDGGTGYERVAGGVVVASFVGFAFGAGVLFGWVSLDGRIGGVPAVTYVGGGLLAMAAAVAGLGGGSRWGRVPTTPDDSVGVGAGLVQTVLWTVTVGFVSSGALGFGVAGWLLAVPAGVSAGALTVGTREDVGSTLPTAAFVGVVGIVVVTGVGSPEWAWEPAAFDAVVPGTVVIPLLAMLCGLLAGWTSASAYEGFGTRGRQSGAFLLLSLVVVLVLAVLAFLLVFVFERGVSVVLENLTVSAGTALVLVATALVLVARVGRLRPATAAGTDKLVSFVHLAVAVGLCLITAGLAVAIATGRTLAGYAVTVEPTATVGAVPGLVVGVVLLRVLRGQDASPSPDTEVARRVDRGLRRCGTILGATVLVEVLTWSELAVGGIAVVPTIAWTVGGLALVLSVVRVVGSVSPPVVPEWTAPVSEWSPSLTRSGEVALWASVVACVHVAVTGHPVGTESVGLVAGGSFDWPFVMNPSQGLGIQTGVMPAMLGTVWIVAGAVAFAVPLAVGSAVYLTEYASGSAFTRAVDIATNGLWSTPSIVFGLFGLAFLVPRFGDSPSIFATQLVLGFMLLPLVLITSREAMKSVPDEYRDASAALGVSKWATIRSVVVPAAMPGVVTGVILGVGRIAGETAPLLLVLNGPNFPNSAPGVLSSFAFDVTLTPPFVHVSNPALLERASALPYQLYAVITAGVGAEESFGWGTALVLLGVVLGFFAMGVATRRYFRTKLYQ